MVRKSNRKEGTSNQSVRGSIAHEEDSGAWGWNLEPSEENSNQSDRGSNRNERGLLTGARRSNRNVDRSFACERGQKPAVRESNRRKEKSNRNVHGTVVGARVPGALDDGTLLSVRKSDRSPGKSDRSEDDSNRNVREPVQSEGSSKPGVGKSSSGDGDSNRKVRPSDRSLSATNQSVFWTALERAPDPTSSRSRAEETGRSEDPKVRRVPVPRPSRSSGSFREPSPFQSLGKIAAVGPGRAPLVGFARSFR